MRRIMPPKFPQPTDINPFSSVLLEHMWTARGPVTPTNSPMTTGDLAARLHVSRNTVINWINRAEAPNTDRQLAVLDELHIPYERLARAYEERGDPLPLALQRILEARAEAREAAAAAQAAQSGRKAEPDEAPRPRTYVPPQKQQRAATAPAGDAWADFLAGAERQLRDQGMMDEDAIRAFIAHMAAQRHRQQGQPDPDFARHVIAEHAIMPAPAREPEKADEPSPATRRGTHHERRASSPTRPRTEQRTRTRRADEGK